MKSSHVTIVFSGGLDSTYLLWKALRNRQNVRTVYISLLNNEIMDSKQKLAIGKIKKKAKKYAKTINVEYQHSNICDISIKPISNIICMKQALIWISILPFVIHEKCTEIQFGYIMEDHAISYISDLQNLWNLYNAFTRKLYHLPPITYPLIKNLKEDIINELPKKWLRHVWYCEEPTSIDSHPCSACKSCIRHKKALDYIP